jgi:DHA1 family bicyclomycin/chloramphenicol resistance-like MFS transporter
MVLMDRLSMGDPPGSPTRQRREITTRELTVMLGLAMSTGALGIDAMLPAFDDIRADLGLAPESTSVGMIITSYFVGLAVGQLVYGPLADRFGRRWTLHLSLATYAAGALASALAPTLTVLVLTRFVWGLGGAGPRVVAMAVVRDRFDGDQMSQVMSSLMAVFILVPIAAPSLGAGVVAVASWQWLFIVCMLFALAVGAWTWRLPETLRPEHRMELSAGRIAAAARAVAAERRSVGYLVAVTFLMGVFVAYLSGFESVIAQAYDRASDFPLIFGGLAAVMGVTMLANRRLVIRYGAVNVTLTTLALYVVLAVPFVILAAATGGRPPFVLFLIGMAVMLSCHAVLLPNLNSIALEPMAGIAGTAASVIGSAQTAGGALLGGILMATFDGTARPLVYGFLVFAVLAGAAAWWTERETAPAA